MPAIRRVLTDPAVNSLADQVGMTGVPAVLLDQVADEPAQAGLATVGPGHVDQLIEPAVGQRRVQPFAGPVYCAVPERVQLFGGCRRRRS